MKEFNISVGRENYSQRNNALLAAYACGPTNMIQALEYAGWQWDKSLYPEFKQPEDKLLKFCRVNKDVLKYYKEKYKSMYSNWWTESHEIAKKQKLQYWEVACPNSYPPNELHDVMSYATNLFIGYTARQLSEMKRRPVTRFYEEFDEYEIIWQICKGLPVVSSVDPFKKQQGHYITIVGFTADDDFKKPTSYEDVTNHRIFLGYIKEYIIDNTYGVFDFESKCYLAKSGDDEHIERSQFLDIVKPVTHYFSPGASCCC